MIFNFAWVVRIIRLFFKTQSDLILICLQSAMKLNKRELLKGDESINCNFAILQPAIYDSQYLITAPPFRIIVYMTEFLCHVSYHSPPEVSLTCHLSLAHVRKYRALFARNYLLHSQSVAYGDYLRGQPAGA